MVEKGESYGIKQIVLIGFTVRDKCQSACMANFISIRIIDFAEGSLAFGTGF